MATFNKLKSARGTIFAKRAGMALRVPSPMEAWQRLFAWARRDAALRRSRRTLLDLSPEQLRDVGLTREEALREGRRSLYLD